MRSQADVAIVGGGILGAATSYELAKHGYKVIVFEKGAINRGGSGATAGNLHIQAVHKKRPQQEVELDQVRFLPLQLAASNLWDHVEDELEESVEMRRIGGLTIAESEDDEKEIRSKKLEEEKLGIPGELLTPDTLKEFEPLIGSTVRLAEYCPLDGYVNPLKITPAWLRAGIRMGVEVHPFTSIETISESQNGWKISSKNESWWAKNVILVPGPWTSTLMQQIGIEIEMNSVAIQIHLTERIPPRMKYLIQHIGQGLSVKQVDSGQILIGGGWPAKELRLHGTSPVSFDSVVGNMQLATRVLPFLKELRLLRAWTGALGATADEMPIIGKVPDKNGIYVAGGTYSFTFAPLWAKILTQLINEQPLEVSIDGLEPGRLIANESKRETENE
jgi:sarcosine oxidase, subunit beta